MKSRSGMRLELYRCDGFASPSVSLARLYEYCAARCVMLMWIDESTVKAVVIVLIEVLRAGIHFTILVNICDRLAVALGWQVCGYY